MVESFTAILVSLAAAVLSQRIAERLKRRRELHAALSELGPVEAPSRSSRTAASG